MTTSIEIEVFGSLKPGVKARLFCYACGIENNHVFMSEQFQLTDETIDQILDCKRFIKTTKNNSVRYFLKEWF